MLTWVQIDKKALRHNLRQFRKLIGQKSLLMPVIKSNAYGHGIREVGRFLDREPVVDRICVVHLDEALELRKLGVKKPIIVLAIYELSAKSIALAIKNKIILPLYTLQQANFVNKIAKKLGKKAVVHLKLDIGTSRIGFMPSEATRVARHLAKLSKLYVEGIFGHYASSEDNRERTARQHAQFKKTIANFEKEGIYAKIVHSACTAASIYNPETRANAIRLGISFYGLKPTRKIDKYIKLKPALAWHTTVIQVKSLPKGSQISYGGTYTTNKKTLCAVLPVGYWDGYDRGAFSNKAEVLIHGKRFPVRGRICMNMTVVDVGNAKNVKVGDIATLIGKQGKSEITVDELADLAKTINYEIVTRINPLLPRKLV